MLGSGVPLASGSLHADSAEDCLVRPEKAFAAEYVEAVDP